MQNCTLIILSVLQNLYKLIIKDLKMESYQNLSYQKGFGNSFFTEAIEGVVPQRNVF